MLLLNIDGLSDIWKMVENDTFDDYVMKLLDTYESFGPLPGILLPMVEAFLPFLPLIVFVITNSMAYGLIEGFLYSWIGAVVGAILVFLIIRRLGQKKFFNFIRQNKQVQKVMQWFERHGFGPLFLLMCFPFSPSAIINIVGGLSRVKLQQFVLAVLMGKTVMIFTIAYVGESITSFAENPLKTIIVGICIVLFWVVGKIIEGKIQKRSELARKEEEMNQIFQKKSKKEEEQEKGKMDANRDDVKVVKSNEES
ncbi:TVP38/TMEM64 family protein [Salirhabdus sp. Marseille-P4669]|uniref:TVP38/TMEM64 family protein n=1 Tax=Salirhabdus sp. Marseille-P4669 TaxID=2042310 RepID=UPI000C7DE29D|nr:TVP38/TMEM64 family protein [Salirhabdus sp. Marseille-P4669]